MNVDALLKEAAELAAAREQIGRKLMAVLADTDQDESVQDSFRRRMKRIEAARLLGELQYSPAIDLLVQHIDLPGSWLGASNWPYPVGAALALYEYAAVPQLVDTFLIETNQSRQLAIFNTIRLSFATDAALQYLRGLEPPDAEDVLRKENMERLERRLTSDYNRSRQDYREFRDTSPTRRRTWVR